MEPNCKNKFNLDHIYCHTNDNNYIRASTGTTSTGDVLTMIKENKHLKAMLLLHLDLIQEQSDQIMAKEKLISTLREENNSLKLRLERMERRSQLRSHKNVELLPIIPVSVSTTSSGISPATAKIAKTVSSVVTTNAISTVVATTVSSTSTNITSDHFDNVEDKKENIPGIPIIEPSTLVSVSSISPSISAIQQVSSPSVVIPQLQQQQLNNKYKVCDETFPNDSIIGESNGKLISKIVLQRVQIPKTIESSLLATTKKFEYPSSSAVSSKQHQQQKSNDCKSEIDIKKSPSSSISEFQNIEIKIEPETSDTLGLDDHHHLSLISQHHDHNQHHLHASKHRSHHHVDQQDHLNTEQLLDLSSSSLSSLTNQRKRKRLGFMTTKSPYRTREWEDEPQICFEDENKEEVEALKAEEPNLEIPKWTIKEFTGLYSIEGTEDLSDDVFAKRHAKLEHDERRRKKWDVQRIREQRTIERLRRRHYKDELQQQENQDEIATFYPTLDQIKFIQITDDLPVQAFGECIPRIAPSEFSLPWLDSMLISGEKVITTAVSSTLTSFGSGTVSTVTNSSSLSLLSSGSSSQQQQQQQQQSQPSTLSATNFDTTIDSNATQFIFIKKKRRLQSQCGTPAGGPSTSKRGRRTINK